MRACQRGVSVILVFVLLGLSNVVRASPALDQRYGLRKIFVAVVNGEEESVHAGAVQTELTRLVRADSRFEWSDEAAQVFTQNRKSAPTGNLGFPKKENLAPWIPFLQSVAEGRAEAIVLSELQKENDTYFVFTTFLAMPNAEVIHSARFIVEDRYALPAFTQAARLGWQEIARNLPFDATVLSRENYRVILDRGSPNMRPGMFLPTFTLEMKAGLIYLLETGRIQLTRVEKNLSFGKIAVERKPLEVSPGNKVRVGAAGNSGFLVETDPTPPQKTALNSFPDGIRSLASSESPGELSEDIAFKKGTFGNVDIDLAGTFLTWNRSATTGQFSSQSAFYPGGNIRGEVWITRQLFADFGFGFGISSFNSQSQVPPVTLNTQINQIRGQVGYRMGLTGSQSGPSIEARAGLSRMQYQVDDSLDPFAPASLTYGGFLVGGGIRLPLTTKYLLGLDFNGLLLGSLSEGSGTSGASTSGVSAWDFAFKTVYNLTHEFNVSAKIAFQTNSASFTGQGTRAVSLTSTSQSSRALLLGMSYFF